MSEMSDDDDSWQEEELEIIDPSKPAPPNITSTNNNYSSYGPVYPSPANKMMYPSGSSSGAMGGYSNSYSSGSYSSQPYSSYNNYHTSYSGYGSNINNNSVPLQPTAPSNPSNNSYNSSLSASNIQHHYGYSNPNYTDQPGPFTKAAMQLNKNKLISPANPNPPQPSTLKSYGFNSYSNNDSAFGGYSNNSIYNSNTTYTGGYSNSNTNSNINSVSPINNTSTTYSIKANNTASNSNNNMNGIFIKNAQNKKLSQPLFIDSTKAVNQVKKKSLFEDDDCQNFIPNISSSFNNNKSHLDIKQKKVQQQKQQITKCNKISNYFSKKAQSSVSNSNYSKSSKYSHQSKSRSRSRSSSLKSQKAIKADKLLLLLPQKSTKNVQQSKVQLKEQKINDIFKCQVSLNQNNQKLNQKSESFIEKNKDLEEQNKNLLEIIKNLSKSLKLSAQNLNSVIKGKTQNKNSVQNMQQNIKQITILTNDDYKITTLVGFKLKDSKKVKSEIMIKIDQLTIAHQILVDFIVVTKIQHLTPSNQKLQQKLQHKQIAEQYLFGKQYLNHSNKWFYESLKKQNFEFLYPKLIRINNNEIQEVISQISIKIVKKMQKILRWKWLKQQIWIDLDQSFTEINQEFFL